MSVAISLPPPKQISSWLPTTKPAGQMGSAGSGGGVDIWSTIQSQNPARLPAAAAPYIHPLVRQSKARMTQNSLELCTEILGSETGSSEFNELGRLPMSPSYDAEDRTDNQEGFTNVVNGSHHRSSRRSPARSFPPPLSSISGRDGPSIHVSSRRCDGRLVLEVFPVAPQSILHAHRHQGRLLLSFAGTNIKNSTSIDIMQEEEQVKEPEDVYDGEEARDGIEYEEEEEVVDRGTVVEVKVSTQQQQIGAMVLRTAIMINKFVGCARLNNENRLAKPPALSPQRRMPPATTTATGGSSGRISCHFHIGGCRTKPVCYQMEASFYIEEEKPGGDAAQHAAVQRAPETTFLLGAMLHCYHLLKNSAIKQYYESLIHCHQLLKSSAIKQYYESLIH